jgi:hypothetical protein
VVRSSLIAALRAANRLSYFDPFDIVLTNMPYSNSQGSPSTVKSETGGEVARCHICPDPNADEATSYGISYSDLCASAEADCVSCIFIRNGIRRVLDDDEPIINSLWFTVQDEAWTTVDDKGIGFSSGSPTDPRSIRTRKLYIYISTRGQNKCIELYTDDGTLIISFTVLICGC